MTVCDVLLLVLPRAKLPDQLNVRPFFRSVDDLPFSLPFCPGGLPDPLGGGDLSELGIINAEAFANVRFASQTGEKSFLLTPEVDQRMISGLCLPLSQILL